MAKEGYKVFYTSVAINFDSKLVTIDNHCYVSNPKKLPELIKGWNRQGRSKYHYYISLDNQEKNELACMSEISDLEYVH